MGSARHLTIAAAAFALVVAGAPVFAGQGQSDWAGPRLQGPSGDAAFKNRTRSPRRGAAVVPVEAAVAPAPPRAAEPPSAAAPPAAPAPPAASISAPPELADPLPTLPAPTRPTDDAPEIPPVMGGGGGGPHASATPEPTTLLLMGTGLAGLYQLRRKR
jgi:PEP-CTERM motif-containing protein